MKFTKLGRQFLLLIQAPLVVGLLVSSYSYIFSPVNTPWVGIAGLLFPICLLLQLFFSLFWFTKSLKFGLGSSTVLAIAILPHLHSLIRFSPKLADPSNSHIKVLSGNVHGWNPYYPTNKDSAIEFFSQALIEQNADIICFQEYLDKQDQLPFDFPYKAQFSNGYNANFGYVVFSKFPILDKGRVEFSLQRGTYKTFMWCDIKIDTKTIRMVNVHLVNTGLTPEEYQSLGGESQEELNSEKLEIEGKAIFKNLSESYAIRAQQVDELEKFITNSPYPVILSGDFNDTPTSYAYKKIAKHLNDGFAESGVGLGDTYNKMKFASLRIDYIFADPTLKLRSFKALPLDVSDHKPITCIIEL